MSDTLVPMKPKVEELARRLCVVNGGGPATTVERHRPDSRPCVFHLELARRYWGLIDNPNGLAALRVLDEYAEEVEE